MVLNRQQGWGYGVQGRVLKLLKNQTLFCPLPRSHRNYFGEGDIFYLLQERSCYLWQNSFKSALKSQRRFMTDTGTSQLVLWCGEVASCLKQCCANMPSTENGKIQCSLSLVQVRRFYVCPKCGEGTFTADSLIKSHTSMYSLMGISGCGSESRKVASLPSKAHTKED